jgi:hypothetical protein
MTKHVFNEALTRLQELDPTENLGKVAEMNAHTNLELMRMHTDKSMGFLKVSAGEFTKAELADTKATLAAWQKYSDPAISQSAAAVLQHIEQPSSLLQVLLGFGGGSLSASRLQDPLYGGVNMPFHDPIINPYSSNFDAMNSDVPPAAMAQLAPLQGAINAPSQPPLDAPSTFALPSPTVFQPRLPAAAPATAPKNFRQATREVCTSWPRLGVVTGLSALVTCGVVAGAAALNKPVDPGPVLGVTSLSVLGVAVLERKKAGRTPVRGQRRGADPTNPQP